MPETLVGVHTHTDTHTHNCILINKKESIKNALFTIYKTDQLII